MAKNPTRNALKQARLELHNEIRRGSVAGAVHLAVREGKTFHLRHTPAAH